MQSRAIPGPWAAGERIWTTLYIEDRRALQLSEEERDRIADTLRLAETLRGEAVTLPASNRSIVDDVIHYAQLRVLLIVTFRPEFEPPWIGHPYVTPLTINRLAEREVGSTASSATSCFRQTYGRTSLSELMAFPYSWRK